MLKNTSIAARLNVLAATVVVAIVVLCAFAVVTIQGQNETRVELGRLSTVRAAAQRVQYDFADFNGWQTAYSLDVAKLGPQGAQDSSPSRKAFLEAIDRTRTNLEALVALTVGEDERHVTRINDAAELFDQFLEVDARIAALYLTGDEQDATAADKLVLEDAIAIYDEASQNLATVADETGEEQVTATKAADAAGSRAAWLMALIGLLVLGAVLAFATAISRSVRRPLAQLAEASDRLAVGDLAFEVDTTRTDEAGQALAALARMKATLQRLLAELGTVARAYEAGDVAARVDATGFEGGYLDVVTGVNAMLDTVIAPLEEVSRILAAMEGGDLTRTITTPYAGRLEDLRRTTNNTVETLARTVAEVASATQQLTNAAEQISGASQALSQATTEQAATVEETSAGMEQMATSVAQNSDNAKVTDGIASQAAGEAREGGEAVGRTVEAMKEIAAKIAIIDDIAFQTNMLALNATIEAARAGDHGKGFAVVASEVGKLAERSQVAAQEIGELASNSVRTAERAGTLLDGIVPSIGRTSDLVREIASSSAEQTQGVTQINRAIVQMSTVTQQNASSSEELAATAEELMGQAESLRELMRFFTVGRAGGSSAGQGARSGRASVPAQPSRLSRTNVYSSAGSRNDGPLYDEEKFERF